MELGPVDLEEVLVPVEGESLLGGFDVKFVLELVNKIDEGQLEFRDALDALPPNVEGTESLEIGADV